MKKTITLALALLTFAAEAQYNNTYDVNANNDNLAPSFVITNRRSHSTTVSFASDGPVRPRRDYFILTKHDEVGNVIYNNRIDPFNAPNDGFTNVEALIETDDEGTLVAGYYYENEDFVEQPFLIKVDVSGNLQWARIYHVNQKPMVNAEINKISLCRVYNDDKEHYFIVGAGDSEHRPGRDVATNVIKVENDGTLIFSKKYYNTSPDRFSMVREYPGDMEFTTRDKFFMITGYRQDVANDIGSHLMYYFGIDNNGNVVTRFLTLQSKSIPRDQDMVYNREKDIFATTFTHFRTNYVQGIKSLIGFINVDAGLNVSNPKYLWHYEGIEHNGRSISISASGDYLLCSGVYENTDVLRAHNPAWLKVDVSGSPVTRLIRYNVKDNVFFGHHATTYNSNGDEEHVLVNEHKTDLRMIRTDANGRACGSVEYRPYDKEYEPKEALYRYDYKKQEGEKRYKPYEKLFEPKYRKCDGEGSSYRTTGIAQAASGASSLLVYPSVISAGNARLTLENNSGAGMKVELYNVAGQLIYTNSQVAAGKTEITINGNLSTGIYLVKIYEAAGELSGTSKILVTE